MLHVIASANEAATVRQHRLLCTEIYIAEVGPLVGSVVMVVLAHFKNATGHLVGDELHHVELLPPISLPVEVRCHNVYSYHIAGVIVVALIH